MADYLNNAIFDSAAATGSRVRDLIETLQRFDPNLPVCFHAGEEGDLFQFSTFDVDGTCSDEEPEVLRIAFTEDPEEPIE